MACLTRSGLLPSSSCGSSSSVAEPAAGRQPSPPAERSRRAPRVPRFRYGPSGRRYDGQLLLLLRPHHRPRAWAIDCIEDDWFDKLVLLIIFANCVAMAARDPLTVDDGWSARLEWAFTGLFTAEMAIKMAAMGISPLESRHCYFSEGWNCLDGFIVLVS